MYESTASVDVHAPVAEHGLAASRQPFPIELEAEFSEMQASAPCPSFLPAALATSLLFHALLIAERMVLQVNPSVFALRGVGVTALAVALMLLPARQRGRAPARALAVLTVMGMMAALVAGIHFAGVSDLLAIQSGTAALILVAGVMLRLPLAWAVTLTSGALLVDAFALVAVPNLPLMLKVESLWAPGLAAAFSILSSWVRTQEARREFLATRRATFADVQPTGLEASHLDELTGIANRTAFDMRLRAAWEHAITRRNSVALLVFTIDEFSQQKKQYGQKFGDMLQTQVASMLKDGLRRSDDMVARYDMHHFVVMLPGVGLDGATQIAERLRGCVEEIAVYVGSNRHRTTVTVGVASMRAKRGVHRDHLVEGALNALEQAKSFGANVVFIEGRGCLPRMA